MTEIVFLLIVKYVCVALVFVMVAIIAKGQWRKRIFIAILVSVATYAVLDVATTQIWRYWMGTQVPSGAR